jgi:hypothetical protein
MAVYATEHGGSYAGVSGPNDLAAIESSINVSDPNRPQLTVASGTDSGFTVTALAPVSGDTYTIASRHGVLAHTCAAGTGPWSPGGCAGGTW